MDRYLSMCTCTHMAHCNDYMGVGAPVTQDVFGHRALKKQQNEDIMGSLGTLKHALQTNFGPIKKLSSFTKVMNKVQNIKNNKFSFKWPKRL